MSTPPPETYRAVIGEGATQGFETISRAAAEMRSDGRIRPFYELSHEYSDQMPLSPFASPISQTYEATSFLASHAANGDSISGQVGSQGTKIDALGHFGYRDVDGTVRYFGGLTQQDVKPSEESPLLQLGMDHAPPIMTSAVLLDATLIRGRSMFAGEEITSSDIKEALTHQGVRPPAAGDALLIYTGWEKNWLDENPDPMNTEYYRCGPGLSSDAARHLESLRISCVGMDVPFIDPVADGYLQGAADAPPDTPDELPFFVHHHNLTRAGIYQVHNMHLAELASDRVYVSAIFILPLRIRGAANSAVRPVAIGSPQRAPQSPE